jgi:hypothetical protein
MSGRRQRQPWIALLTAAAMGGLFIGASAGPLEPPGDPGEPTMIEIDKVDPRIPIHNDMMPFTITERGSYYLAGNIATTGAGILIQANGVTIDLMGFTLSGGTGPGIDASTSWFTTIRNGTVREWSGTGIRAGNWPVLSGLTVVYNQGSGIEAGVVARITRCTANYNSVHGIVTDKRSMIRSCVANDNGENGIWLNNGIVSRCVVDNNDKNGIRVFSSASVVDNHVRGNDAAGVNGKSGIWVFGNDSRVQGILVIGNNNGIEVGGSWNTVVQNIVGDSRSANFVSEPLDPSVLIDAFTIGDTGGPDPWDNIEQP